MSKPGRIRGKAMRSGTRASEQCDVRAVRASRCMTKRWICRKPRRSTTQRAGGEAADVRGVRRSVLGHETFEA
eukprot:7021756-Pyramimonas_sp.AAC.1